MNQLVKQATPAWVSSALNWGRGIGNKALATAPGKFLTNNSVSNYLKGIHKGIVDKGIAIGAGRTITQPFTTAERVALLRQVNPGLATVPVGKSSSTLLNKAGIPLNRVMQLSPSMSEQLVGTILRNPLKSLGAVASVPIGYNMMFGE